MLLRAVNKRKRKYNKIGMVGLLSLLLSLAVSQVVFAESTPISDKFYDVITNDNGEIKNGEIKEKYVSMEEKDKVEHNGVTYFIARKKDSGEEYKAVAAEDEGNEGRIEKELIVPEFIEKDGVQYPVVQIGFWNHLDNYVGVPFSGNKYTSIKIPSSVKAITGGSFQSSTKIEELVIPEGVEIIDDFAFSNCRNLKKVTLPASLRVLGTGVFSGCEQLTEIEVNDANPYLMSNNKGIFSKDGKNLYIASRNIKEYTVPDTVVKINDGTFTDSTIESITIPDSVVEIGDEAFFRCYDLKSVSLGEGLKSIGKKAFASTSIESIDLPDTLETLGASAFSGCVNLKSITIPESIQSISYSAFGDCLQLSEITLSEGIKEIQDYAFYNCKALKSIQIPSTVEEIGTGILLGCDKLEQIKVASGNKDYKAVNNQLLSFSGRTLLCAPKTGKKYTIPNGVITIKSGAIFDKSLKELTISKSVKNFYMDLGQCQNLKKIIFLNKKPPKIYDGSVNDNGWEDPSQVRDAGIFMLDNPELIIPKGSKKAYQKALPKTISKSYLKEK